MRVAVIGVGPRAVSSIDALRASGTGDPVGVWDRTHAVASAAADRWGVPSFATIGELVTSTAPDLVAVMTHPSFRLIPLDESLAAGATAVLIEKPIALTEDELDRIERRAGLAFVAVNTQYLWMPHWQRILRRIRDGELGALLSIRLSTAVDVLDQGPHLLSLGSAVADAAGVVGETWVQAVGSGRSEYGGVAHPESMCLAIERGRLRVLLTAGAASPTLPAETNRYFQQQIDVLGERGSAMVTLNAGAEMRIDGGIERWSTAWPRDDGDSQAAAWGALRSALENPETMGSFPSRLEESARQMRILFEGIRSAAAGADRRRVG